MPKIAHCLRKPIFTHGREINPIENLNKPDYTAPIRNKQKRRAGKTAAIFADFNYRFSPVLLALFADYTSALAFSRATLFCFAAPYIFLTIISFFPAVFVLCGDEWRSWQWPLSHNGRTREFVTWSDSRRRFAGVFFFRNFPVRLAGNPGKLPFNCSRETLRTCEFSRSSCRLCLCGLCDGFVLFFFGVDTSASFGR